MLAGSIRASGYSHAFSATHVQFFLIRSYVTGQEKKAMLFTIAAAALAAASALMVGNGTVYKTGSTYSVKFGVVDKTGVAYGSYKDLLFSLSAFGQLNIETNNAFDDNSQMYALGYLEGALTWERIHQQVRLHCTNAYLMRF